MKPVVTKKHGYCATTMTFYAVTYAELSRVARDHGYALALHGSLRRDLDLIAVPWTKKAKPETVLVKAICQAAGGMISDSKNGGNPEKKPHGRRGWVIHLGGCSATIPPDERATYIDLSVMPRR